MFSGHTINHTMENFKEKPVSPTILQVLTYQLSVPLTPPPHFLLVSVLGMHLLPSSSGHLEILNKDGKSYQAVFMLPHDVMIMISNDSIEFYWVVVSSLIIFLF